MNLSEQARSHIIAMARKRVQIKQIALRCGVKPDAVRKLVTRAEERGELPPGTLEGCGCKRRPRPNCQPKPEPEPCAEGPLQVLAPQRRICAELGPCSACGDATDVVVRTEECELRLCRLHAPELVRLLDQAIQKAMRGRTIFNHGARNG